MQIYIAHHRQSL